MTDQLSKKERILKLFESAEWIPYGAAGRSKILTYEGLKNAGLSPTVEYSETHSDPQYAAKILRKMGYRVHIGSCIFIYEKPPLKTKP